METYFLLRGVVYQSVACLSPKYTVTTLVRTLYDMADSCASGLSRFYYFSGEYNGTEHGKPLYLMLVFRINPKSRHIQGDVRHIL